MDLNVNVDLVRPMYHQYMVNTDHSGREPAKGEIFTAVCLASRLPDQVVRLGYFTV